MNLSTFFLTVALQEIYTWFWLRGMLDYYMCDLEISSSGGGSGELRLRVGIIKSFFLPLTVPPFSLHVTGKVLHEHDHCSR